MFLEIASAPFKNCSSKISLNIKETYKYLLPNSNYGRCFQIKNPTYDFQNAEILNRSNVNSVNYGTLTITSLGAKVLKKILLIYYIDLIWATLYINAYIKIKNWETDEYPSRLSKTYIQRVGFISLGIVTPDECLLNIILFFIFYFLFFCLGLLLLL